MMVKYARASILDVRSSRMQLPSLDETGFSKLAKPSVGEVSEDGYLYVKVRAISSRVNKNHDGWPSEELAKSFASFENKPVFVDHNNDDPDRTRGVIVWSKLNVEDEKTSALDPYYSTAPDNHKPPTWIELMIEVDAHAFPKLAQAITSGEIDAVSMGANIQRSVCSVCDNEALTPDEYCSHVKQKGVEFEIVSATGEKHRKLAYEDCYGIGFFEISFVFDPADETALISEMSKAARSEKTAELPPESQYQIGQSVGYKMNGNDYRGWIKRLAGEDDSSLPEMQEFWRGQGVRATDPMWYVQHNPSVGTPHSYTHGYVPHGALYPVDDEHGPAGEHLEDDDIYKGLNLAAVKTANEQRARMLSKLMERGMSEQMAERLSARYAAPGDVHHNLVERGGESPEEGLKPRNPNYEPQADMMTAPSDVDTLRPDLACKECGTELEENQDGRHLCPRCGWEQPPVGLDNPDLGLAHEYDLHEQQQKRDQEMSTPHNTELPTLTPQDTPNPAAPQGEGSLPNVQPVRPMMHQQAAVTHNETTTEAVISEMDWTVKARAFVEGDTDDVLRLDERTAAPKKVILKNKKATDGPTDAKVVSDQLAPVESSLTEAAMKCPDCDCGMEGDKCPGCGYKKSSDKTADREVIKRVEEDGSGTKRTEEIVKEFGPVGDDAPAEGTEGEDEAAEGEEESEDSSDPFGSEQKDESKDEKKEEPSYLSSVTPEQKLMAALRLAKLASDMKVIDRDEELNYVSNLEEETMEQIEARTKMLKEVKEAGLSKASPRPSLASRFPSMKVASAGVSGDDLDNIPDEALFF